MGVSQNYGYPLRGPQNKDYSILGSMLGYDEAKAASKPTGTRP